ncbi:MAG: hypothetical protein RLZZ524_146 [Pseudomonadota bacterium]
MTRREIAIVAVIALALVGAGAAVGWYFTRPAAVIETAKPAETQADGSTLLERAPTTPSARPRQIVPKGAKVERVGSITAQGATPDEIKACTSVPCPPVTIDTSLVRLPDGSKRVIVSSADGTILKGVDIPVETQEVPEPKVWAAGVSLDPLRQTMGAWVERDIARVRVGVEINQTRPQLGGPVGAEVRLRAGWVF